MLGRRNEYFEGNVAVEDYCIRVDPEEPGKALAILLAELL